MAKPNEHKNAGNYGNTPDGSGKPRATKDREEADAHVPYYPAFNTLDWCGSVGINERNCTDLSRERPSMDNRVLRATTHAKRS